MHELQLQTICSIFLIPYLYTTMYVDSQILTRTIVAPTSFSNARQWSLYNCRKVPDVEV